MMAKQFEELSKRAPETSIQEETVPNGTKVKTFGPFVQGYSMTIGPDGKQTIKQFGNFNTEPQLEQPQTEVKKEREPLTDIIDADDKVRVIVELPGVEKESIKLSGTDNKLTISVDSPERKYFKEVELPTKVQIKKVTSEYRNGVLDIIVPKRNQ